MFVSSIANHAATAPQVLHAVVTIWGLVGVLLHALKIGSGNGEMPNLRTYCCCQRTSRKVYTTETYDSLCTYIMVTEFKFLNGNAS